MFLQFIIDFRSFLYWFSSFFDFHNCHNLFPVYMHILHKSWMFLCVFIIFIKQSKIHEFFANRKKLDIRNTIRIVPGLQNIDFDKIRVSTYFINKHIVEIFFNIISILLKNQFYMIVNDLLYFYFCICSYFLYL